MNVQRHCPKSNVLEGQLYTEKGIFIIGDANFTLDTTNTESTLNDKSMYTYIDKQNTNIMRSCDTLIQ